jgi:ferredoxin
MVIIATGQQPDLSFLPEDIKVNRGTISIDKDGATSRPHYFAGGDAVVPGKVAWAIGSGRKAAQAIDRMIRALPGEAPAEKPATKSKLSDTDFIEKKERVQIPLLPTRERHHSFAEVELTLGSKQVTAEAGRCLLCKGMCLVSCPYHAPQFGSEDNPKMQKCDFCMEEWEQGKQPICVRSCTTRALDAGQIVRLQAMYGDIREAEGFVYRENSDPSIIFKPKT